MEIPDQYIITDIRSGKEFKGITLSGYKRGDVIKAYQNSIINNKLEDSIRWCVELHSTGLNKIIWDSLYMIYIKYIHINNPKYFFYLIKRQKEYMKILNKYPKKHEIFTRNNQEIRNLYAELTAISCLTKKNNLFLPKSLPVINLKSYEKDEIKKRMISKNLDKILNYIFNTTSNEIKLGLNEIINNISSDSGTFQNCIYWYIWLEKSKLNNDIKYSDDNYDEHWIFILWNIILNFEQYIHKNDNIFIKKLHHEYKKNFKLSFISKKKYLIFISLYILKNNINWNINIFPKEHIIIQCNSNINIMYKNIKKNIEAKLSEETKDAIYNNYYKLQNKESVKLIKVKETYLDEDINKVTYTKYPDYEGLKNNSYEILDNSSQGKSKNEEILISKNKTLRNVFEEKENKQDKRLDAFVNFITFKNPNSEIKKEVNLENLHDIKKLDF